MRMHSLGPVKINNLYNNRAGEPFINMLKVVTVNVGELSLLRKVSNFSRIARDGREELERIGGGGVISRD